MKLNKQTLTILGIGAALALGGLFMLTGNSGVSTVSDSAKLDQSRTVESNVGDQAITVGDGSIQGFEFGGDVGSIGQIGNNTNTEANVDASESSETQEGN